MQKIPTLFVREEGGRFVTEEVTPDCEWVLDGEGEASVKWDGTACLIKNGVFYKRHVHKVEKGDPPDGWLHWSFDLEQKSGHGWLPVGDGPEDKWHREAWESHPKYLSADGTYELVGPKVQKNAECCVSHRLWKHGADLRLDAPRTFHELKEWFRGRDMEGLVWRHPDGRMAKIKKRDFGMGRKD